MGRTGAVALVCFFACSPQALAARVTMESTVSGRSHLVRVTVTADPGETNDVAVSGTAADFVVEDRGAPLRQTGCEQLSANRVRCRPGEAVNTFLVVETGDGPDRVVASPRADVQLGPGDDMGRLLGGGAIDGGGGRDVLAGGSGEDSFSDGDDPARPDSDLIDGGGGLDLVSYAARRRPVHVDLRREGPSAGEAGEGDSIAAVESAIGGSAGDRLVAHPEGSALLGRQGGDRLVGRGGDDLLVGGSGRDSLTGKSGDDSLQPNGDDATSLNRPSDRDVGSGFTPDDRTADRMWCGRGADRVRELTGDFMASDCERFHFFDEVDRGRVPAFRPPRRNTLMTLPVGCAAPCRWSLEARIRSGRLRGMLIARRSRTVRRGRTTGRVALRLSTAGKRAFERRRCLHVRVRVRTPRFDRGSFAYLTKLCR